jgi:hypothetical protein
MKMTMSALAASALVTATDVRADETVGNTVRLPGSKDAEVTIVYQHALPGISGKSVKGVLVECGPVGYSRSVFLVERSPRMRFRQHSPAESVS